ncbi:hypothetical protein V1511DRAFT_131716 [Dipodascopsis uninucleata]
MEPLQDDFVGESLDEERADHNTCQGGAVQIIDGEGAKNASREEDRAEIEEAVIDPMINSMSSQTTGAELSRNADTEDSSLSITSVDDHSIDHIEDGSGLLENSNIAELLMGMDLTDPIAAISELQHATGIDSTILLQAVTTALSSLLDQHESLEEEDLERKLSSLQNIPLRRRPPPRTEEERERIKLENRARKRKWRELNEDRNKDNDLRGRVNRRADLLFGKQESSEKQAWMDAEFVKRKEKRIQRFQKNQGNAATQAIIGEELQQALAELIGDGTDVEVLNNTLLQLARDPNLIKNLTQLIQNNGSDDAPSINTIEQEPILMENNELSFSSAMMDAIKNMSNNASSVAFDESRGRNHLDHSDKLDSGIDQELDAEINTGEAVVVENRLEYPNIDHSTETNIEKERNESNVNLRVDNMDPSFDGGDNDKNQFSPIHELDMNREDDSLIDGPSVGEEERLPLDENQMSELTAALAAALDSANLDQQTAEAVTEQVLSLTTSMGRGEAGDLGDLVESLIGSLTSGNGTLTQIEAVEESTVVDASDANTEILQSEGAKQNEKNDSYVAGSKKRQNDEINTIVNRPRFRTPRQPMDVADKDIARASSTVIPRLREPFLPAHFANLATPKPPAYTPSRSSTSSQDVIPKPLLVKSVIVDDENHVEKKVKSMGFPPSLRSLKSCVTSTTKSSNGSD